MIACRNALVFLISLLLGFVAEGALTQKKTHANAVQSFRGTLKKATRGVAKKSSDDDNDDDDDDDDDDDEESDKKVQVTQIDAHKAKEIESLKHELADNKHEQEELTHKIKHLTDESKSDREIDASARLVGNETQSPAMASMLGKMWKEMRMFETPFYAEHVEEELHHLKHKQHAIEAKLADAEGAKSTVREPEDSAGEVVLAKSHPGSADCPCIGINELEGETIATLKDGSKVAYPADLGGQCEAWDFKKHPKCPGASWCKQQWCYVDPCNCKNVGVLPKPSIYLPGAKYQGKPVHFSYATCGGKDSYSSEKDKKKTEKDIAKTCAVEVDSSTWGAENCRCVGVSPQPGTTKVSIKDKLVEFPADTGAVCKSWEKDNHPDCDSDDAPDWCNQAWCYVDPCSCKLPTPPKTSSYLPSSSYKEKPIYYSYATCGGKDSWTSGNKKACVNQKTSGGCGKLDKCAWTGKECLGKELVNVCGLDEKSASWSPKAFVALLLPLLALFH